MQSQQKRVKWSRGETAEALEERTDTGITMASVELMENLIPDMYGNLSRRPALKPLTNNIYDGFRYDKYLQIFPFYITETDYILVGVHYDTVTEFIRVKDGVMVYKAYASSDTHPKTKAMTALIGAYEYRPVSFAQQNNYMIIADSYNVYKLQFNLSPNDSSFTANMLVWEFSAGWYAPQGTYTNAVDSSQVTGLSFTANSIKNYIMTEQNGQTTVYSSIKTGISLTPTSGTWTSATTTFYVSGTKSAGKQYNGKIKTTSAGADASFTMTNGTTYADKQTVCNFSYYTDIGVNHIAIKVRITNNQAYFYFSTGTGSTRDCSADFTSTLPLAIESYIPAGSIVHFPNNGAYMRVEGYDSDGTDQIMFGALLTPVADDNATDTVVNVEYGYQSLMPEEWLTTENYPHPKKVVFHNQRLWAGAWAYNVVEEYALTIGSQIGRYNDFKNDYNQENESITLDILTQFQERILHLIDYNGLKIMTESYEYAYESGGVVKQSANGSLEICQPIIFDSLCLYVDATGYQVKAMQYEFQSNIYNSTTINQVTPHDLVWFPFCMSSYEDKINSTGKYLFLVNQEGTNIPRMAVCNFVPGNQANIWSRWSISSEFSGAYGETGSLIHSVVNLKNGTLFMLNANRLDGFNTSATKSNVVIPCVLDFEGNVDLEGDTYTVAGNTFYTIVKITNPDAGLMHFTVANAEVAVYSNGVFQFTTTTNTYGIIEADISELTNVTIGLPINAMVRSHPIDVGGKTKSIKKRIGKARMSVRDTEPGALTINGKTGYMNPAKDLIDFYGVTGMKDEIKYTITNNKGAMFHLESLLMNIEYGTLNS